MRSLFATDSQNCTIAHIDLYLKFVKIDLLIVYFRHPYVNGAYYNRSDRWYLNFDKVYSHKMSLLSTQMFDHGATHLLSFFGRDH